MTEEIWEDQGSLWKDTVRYLVGNGRERAPNNR
jgi:hypothetical protein